MIRLTTENSRLASTLRALAANSRRITTYAAGAGISHISQGVRQAILRQGVVPGVARVPTAVRRIRAGHSDLVRSTVLRLRPGALRAMASGAGRLIQKIVSEGK